MRHNYDQWFERFAKMDSGEEESRMMIAASVVVSEAENDPAWFMHRRKLLHIDFASLSPRPTLWTPPWFYDGPL